MLSDQMKFKRIIPGYNIRSLKTWSCNINVIMAGVVKVNCNCDQCLVLASTPPAPCLISSVTGARAGAAGDTSDCNPLLDTSRIRQDLAPPGTFLVTNPPHWVSQVVSQFSLDKENKQRIPLGRNNAPVPSVRIEDFSLEYLLPLG